MGAICGIDGASDWHDVHVADAHGAPLAGEQFSHDEIGVSALIELLLDQRVECCAIERPDGPLVGRLLAAGVVVLAIHPNQVKAARERFRAAAGKNDRFDAFVLCELARTDRHRFPVLAPSGNIGEDPLGAGPEGLCRSANLPTARAQRPALGPPPPQS